MTERVQRGQRRVRAGGAAALALALGLPWAMPVPAATPGQRCAAAKITAAGVRAVATLRCAAAGAPIDPYCAGKAATRFASAFARAEARGGCLTGGDAGDVAALVDGWIAGATAALRPAPDANRCAAAKLRATGRAARGTVRCHAAARKAGVAVDAVCLAKQQAALATAFPRAEARPPCLTTGDAAALGPLVATLAGDLLGRTGLGCPDAGIVSGDHTRTLVHGGLTRTYHVHVPAGYAPGRRTPLVFSFHGGTGTANGHAAQTGLRGKADAAGFVLIEPEGSAGAFGVQTWNAGNCCGASASGAVDDVGFVAAMIDAVGAEACIDAKRVYATGHSNGAMLSYRLACELADRIAAVAPNAGGIGDRDVDQTPPVVIYPCAPARPVPVLHLHGLADGCYPFGGGVGSGISGVNFISIPDTIAGWAVRNGCGPTTTVTYQQGGATCATHDGCAQGADVTLCTLAGHGHAWPGGVFYPVAAMCGGIMSSDLVANDALWDFFTGHPMP
jgi:polyhydroxybutyrate depolymerase